MWGAAGGPRRGSSPDSFGARAPSGKRAVLRNREEELRDPDFQRQHQCAPLRSVLGCLPSVEQIPFLAPSPFSAKCRRAACIHPGGMLHPVSNANPSAYDYQANPCRYSRMLGQGFMEQQPHLDPRLGPQHAYASEVRHSRTAHSCLHACCAVDRMQ